jgi:hypothetical protein
MQRSQISQLIQMRSIGISDTSSVWIRPAIPKKWHIVGAAPPTLIPQRRD